MDFDFVRSSYDYYEKNKNIKKRANVIEEGKEYSLSGKLYRHAGLKQDGEELTYDGDQLDGKARYYHENGLLKASGMYSYNKKFRTWEFYDKYGRFIKQQWFELTPEFFEGEGADAPRKENKDKGK